MSRRREIPTPDGLQITQLRRDHRGVWRARIHLNGEHADATTEFGSWQVDAGDIRREVRPGIAAALQAKVKTEERREKKRDDERPAARVSDEAVRHHMVRGAL